MIKMVGESKLMMNCRLCREKQILTITVRISEWAGCLVRMPDDETLRKVFLGKPD
jgi:hypothetical protein